MPPAVFQRAPGEMLLAKESDLLLVLGERIGPSMSQGYTSGGRRSRTNQ